MDFSVAVQAIFEVIFVEIVGIMLNYLRYVVGIKFLHARNAHNFLWLVIMLAETRMNGICDLALVMMPVGLLAIHCYTREMASEGINSGFVLHFELFVYLFCLMVDYALG